MILTAPGQGPDGDLLHNPDVPVYDEVPPNLPAGALFVAIYREMFSDFFHLTLQNGHSEEIHYEEIRNWFKERGAEMDPLEKALDEAWNFQHSTFIIVRPKTPFKDQGRHTPKL